MGGGGTGAVQLGPRAPISAPPGNLFNVPADISQQKQSIDFAPLFQAVRAAQPGPGAQVNPPPGNPFNVPTDISQQKQSIDFAPLIQAAQMNVTKGLQQFQQGVPPGTFDAATSFGMSPDITSAFQGFRNSLGRLGGLFGSPSVAPNYNQPISAITNNPAASSSGSPSAPPNYNQPIPTLTGNPAPPPTAPTPPPAPWMPPAPAPESAPASAPAPRTPPGVDPDALSKLTPDQLNVYNTLVAGGVPAFMALLSAQQGDMITGSGA